VPIHIIECYLNGHRVEKDIDVSKGELFECSVCGESARVVYDWGKMALDIFQPFIDTNMCDTPVKIESKQQWARECDKRGIVSHALASGYKSYKAKREV
jgi:hypothetical protein